MKVFCSSASPLYFSLLRIRRTVMVDHTRFPLGVDTPSLVSVLAMALG